MDFNGWVSVSKSLELKVINIEELQNALFFHCQEHKAL